jgi:hypothetical protein
MSEQILHGTWPIYPFADHFFGTVQADGQHPRVAAVACHNGDAVLLSLVGYDTSVSAVLAKLWLREAVPFQTAPGIRWEGPHQFHRRTEKYKQISTPLDGTKEVHYLALPSSTHIGEGILHPPDLPDPSKKRPDEIEVKVDRTRFVLGNWNEDTPAERSFLGTLYGMRVLFLHKDAQHPDWPHVWANEIWERGCLHKLIQPVKHALGVRAWALSDDLVAWGRMIGEGTRDGWLPWDRQFFREQMLTVPFQHSEPQTSPDDERVLAGASMSR